MTNGRWARRIAAATMVGLLSVGGSSLVAQEAGKYRAPVYPEDAYIHWPLPPAEPAYSDIDGLHIKEWVKEVVGISHRSRDAGDVMWGRIPGTRSETWTNDWVEAKFRGLGLRDIRRQPFDIPPQWTPIPWDFSVVAGGVSKKFRTVRPAMGSGSTPAAGTNWMRPGSGWAPRRTPGRDVRGKAVFILNEIGELAHGPVRGLDRCHETCASFRRGPPSSRSMEMTATCRRGARSTLGVDTLPGSTIGNEDGVDVRDLIGKGPVKVRARSDVNGCPTSRAPACGTLPATTEENIIAIR